MTADDGLWSGAGPGEAIPARFERVVAKRSDHVAVETERRSVTYRELDRAADAVAARIKEAVGPGPCRVGLLVENDVDFLAAVLGISKSGSVYVPLDPLDPEARLREIAGHAEVQLLVADAKNPERAERVAPGIARIDPTGDGFDERRPLRPALAPDALAYILYTSGSTGRPKGVMQTYAGLLHHVGNYVRALSIGPEDRIGLFFSYGFSASLMDVFSALLSGATLLPHALQRHGILRLSEWVRESGVSVLHCTPSTFRQICRTLGETERLHGVRALDLAGEPLTGADVAACRRHLPPDCVVLNHLAATEVSVIAQQRIDLGEDPEAGLVPVGLCADGVSVDIVDERNQELAAGRAGEIRVTSVFLSPGYWTAPELTRAAFEDLPDGRRRYRTGDLGRLDESGVLTHLGRKGQRVKIRGYTVEVAEVESNLRAHPRISDAVVSAQELRPGRSVLVAHVVASAECAPSATELRAFLRQRLPEFEVPAFWRVLEALPKTPSGKIDRRALPAVEARRPELDVAFCAPRDATEERLQAIWQEELGISPVGVHDPFRDLGGDSLCAVSLLVHVEEELGRHLMLSSLLGDTTIAEMADLFRRRDRGEGAGVLVPMRKAGRAVPWFFVHCGAGHLHSYEELAVRLGESSPVHGFQPEGLDGRGGLCRSVEAFASRYCDAMRLAGHDGPCRLGGWSFGGLVAFEMARQLQDAGQTVGCLVLIDAPVFQALGLRRLPWAHLQDLRSRPASERLAYLRRRLRTFASASAGRLSKRASARPPASDPVEPVPILERDAYFLRITHAAARAYRPARYAGPVELFVSDTETAAAWEPFLDGAQRVHVLGVDHGSIMKPPHIQRIAESLGDSTR